MTEAEWLACEEPRTLWEFVCGKASDRKLRLFSAASFKRLLRALPDPRQQRGVEILEQMAEGTVTANKRRETVTDVRHAIPPDDWVDTQPAIDHLHYVALMLYREFVSSSIATHALSATAGLANGDAERKEQAELLRDIFGNPFRLVAFDPAHLTSTAVALASQMYESRDFSAMPILADALQDAGCDNDDILNHCRDPKQVHVRGCWVVDLVLGKS
jgi:hypothetical protein